MYYFQMDFYEALYVQQVVDQEVPVPILIFSDKGTLNVILSV